MDQNWSCELLVDVSAFHGVRDDIDGLLFDVGLDDALVVWVGDALRVQVDREAPSLAVAVWSAVSQVEQVEGLRVVRVEPADLVSAGEIARRKGRSKQWASMVVSGKRGRGDFPLPFPLEQLATFMWRWDDVEQWFEDGTQPDGAVLQHAAWFMSTINALLDLRKLMARRASDTDDDLPPLSELCD